jgi:hypothetical protein
MPLFVFDDGFGKLQFWESTSPLFWVSFHNWEDGRLFANGCSTVVEDPAHNPKLEGSNWAAATMIENYASY